VLNCLLLAWFISVADAQSKEIVLVLRKIAIFVPLHHPRGEELQKSIGLPYLRNQIGEKSFIFLHVYCSKVVNKYLSYNAQEKI
jgi:hypothetical protein